MATEQRVHSEWRRDFSGAMTAVSGAVGWVESIASDLHLPDGQSYAMQVCLEELMANVAMHGRSPAAPSAEVEQTDPLKVSVSVNVSSDRIILTVEDNGRPFDISTARPRGVEAGLDSIRPGGLGIGVIRSFADNLKYSRTETGNRVTAEFLR
ncbi:MAG TPA: ATP-binding protein [Methylocystis sp.]|nr:ATP-binding protein [Methylocystis sp.]